MKPGDTVIFTDQYVRDTNNRRQRESIVVRVKPHAIIVRGIGNKTAYPYHPSFLTLKPQI